MMDLLMDILLTILLLAAIGFGGISLMGLLIFPDIRSRSFTGLRAGILSIALVTAAAIFYGLYSWGRYRWNTVPLFLSLSPSLPSAL